MSDTTTTVWAVLILIVAAILAICMLSNPPAAKPSEAPQAEPLNEQAAVDDFLIAQMQTWNSGPPPSRGWWPTRRLEKFDRFTQETHDIRWWNGEHWSIGCPHWIDAKEAGLRAHFNTPDFTADQITWAQRPDDWPERSRT